MAFKRNGFDSAIAKITKEVERKADALSGNVALADLLTNEFMEKYSNCSSMVDFFTKTNISTAEEFLACPIEKLDAHVKENSTFDSWEHMKTKAATEYMAKKWNDI